MGKMNVEPLITFSDGSQLLVSSQYTGEGSFTCELYLSTPCGKEKLDLRALSDHLEAPTCREAQDIAFHYAQRQFPDSASGMKEPPYLVWSGPNLPVAPDNRGRRPIHRQQR
ncbi:MAG: hypothetical protein KGO52_16115 [Nitrospirota bacterium]|nr:hypothetical protein [Nitrospirota bacterium]MDE3226738.1 hypothetical protein [Nitrospirota bacterium]MDE3244230.1 hypothetical protein [Nitrospirota bacterium]